MKNLISFLPIKVLNTFLTILCLIYSCLAKAEEVSQPKRHHYTSYVAGTAPQGAQSPNGKQGTIGPTGSTGYTGATGFPGHKGEEGAEGDRGSRGDRGPKGNKGSKGKRGPEGKRGPQGFKGVSGPRGFTGITGATGTTGSKGPCCTGPTGSSIAAPSLSTCFDTYYSDFTNVGYMSFFPQQAITFQNDALNSSCITKTRAIEFSLEEGTYLVTYHVTVPEDQTNNPGPGPISIVTTSGTINGSDTTLSYSNVSLTFSKSIVLHVNSGEILLLINGSLTQNINVATASITFLRLSN